MKAIAENPHIALKELRLANQVLLPVECMHMLTVLPACRQASEEDGT